MSCLAGGVNWALFSPRCDLVVYPSLRVRVVPPDNRRVTCQMRLGTLIDDGFCDVRSGQHTLVTVPGHSGFCESSVDSLQSVDSYRPTVRFADAL